MSVFRVFLGHFVSGKLVLFFAGVTPVGRNRIGIDWEQVFAKKKERSRLQFG